MSGTVGRFTLPAGSKVDEAKIREAVVMNDLKLDGIDTKERAPAAAVWQFKVTDLPT